MFKHQIINSTLELWSSQYTGPKFHAVFCDPPYGLKFMGKDWDVVSAKEWGQAMLPHLYPGALCFMFGGTRTWHKLATGMEDAGFQIWDTLMWLHGQGFPKGQDISKLIDKRNGDVREIVGKDKWFASASNTRDKYNGYSGEDTRDVTAPGSEQSSPWTGHKTPALKPAWEPILAFRVPADGTYAEMALEHGTGALNIDAARIGTAADMNPRDFDDSKRSAPKFSGILNGGKEGQYRGRTGQVPDGRYPANLLLDPESTELLDEQSGFSISQGGKYSGRKGTREDVGKFGFERQEITRPTDSGGASRFFYCAKASTSERNAGLKPLEMGTNKIKNHHPTVKPIALTEYLAKLLLPPAAVGTRRILVPFAGSGSEMIGALKAGWDEVVGIEQDMEQGYCRIADARIKHWNN